MSSSDSRQSFCARRTLIFCAHLILACLLAGPWAPSSNAQVPIEGFLPMVGMALSDEFETLSSSGTFFISEPSLSVSSNRLLGSSGPNYEIALLDTGAATHIITSSAATNFDAFGPGQFDGENFQTVGGATGLIDLRIEDPLGVYIAGLGDRTGAGSNLTLNNAALRGQTSFALLNAPPAWTLPNIIGMPIAAHHQLQIRNSDPQIFQLDGRTVRTPDVQMDLLGATNHGIQRRSPLQLNPGLGFVQGPIYIQNLDIISLELHENPLTPSVIENGSLFVETDMSRGNDALDDFGLFFDTGASLTVVSEQTAVRLGFDPILDTPEFEVQVEGSGGVGGIIPGFYLDELSIDTIGGTFELTDVPVAVLDVANPSDPGNVVPGILGMNVFLGRDIVIDANPQIGQGGAGPSLYISDPVTESHQWAATASTANWVTAGNWSAPGVPDVLWDVSVSNNSGGGTQTATLSTDSTVFRATIEANPSMPGARMAVRVDAGGSLTSFADITVKQDGELQLNGGHVDAQYIDISGGTLSGDGTIFVGSGPITGTVRVEAGGRISPGGNLGNEIGTLDITGGDLGISSDGVVAIDLAGLVAGTSHDQIIIDRLGLLSGTLEVSLSGGFTPQVGDTFTIITAGDAVSGMFETTNLPAGFSWDVDYFASSVRLEVTGLGLVGDFDGDGTLDCDDINLLNTEAVMGGHNLSYDLDGNGQVNHGDVTMWIEDLKQTLIADANLDGEVDGQDFVAWNNHKFTSSTNWCDGDFNADGVVNGQDFVEWNDRKFTSADGFAVPEPAGIALAWLLTAFVALMRRQT